MSGAADMRASDAERDEVVRRLREHATAGRLTMDELDERCSAALAARTCRELRALLHDLPQPAPPAPPAVRGHEAGGYGLRPFTYDWDFDVAPAVALEEALRRIAPELHRFDYELENRGPRRLSFRYSHRPAWTYAVAILLFPVGLLALLHRQDERVTLDFDDAPGGGTRLVVSGRAKRLVRRAFVQLDL